jgi:hypothetical protein
MQNRVDYHFKHIHVSMFNMSPDKHKFLYYLARRFLQPKVLFQAQKSQLLNIGAVVALTNDTKRFKSWQDMLQENSYATIPPSAG